MQSPSADVFRAFVYAESEAGDFVERVRREFQLDAFGFE
jgi:hypothetical protein